MFNMYIYIIIVYTYTYVPIQHHSYPIARQPWMNSVAPRAQELRRTHTEAAWIGCHGKDVAYPLGKHT